MTRPPPSRIDHALTRVMARTTRTRHPGRSRPDLLASIHRKKAKPRAKPAPPTATPPGRSEAAPGGDLGEPAWPLEEITHELEMILEEEREGLDFLRAEGTAALHFDPTPEPQPHLQPISNPSPTHLQPISNPSPTHLQPHPSLTLEQPRDGL